jgi:tRNA dimethylallyltransferase
MRRGLLDEVRRLHARPDLHAALPAIRLIGYRQLWNHLDGSSSIEMAVQKAIVATRQLARRQLTWLRAEPGAIGFDSEDPATLGRVTAHIAEWLGGR